MTAPFTDSLKQAKGSLSASKSAKLCGVHSRTFQRWLAGHSTPPRIMQEMVIQILTNHGKLS